MKKCKLRTRSLFLAISLLAASCFGIPLHSAGLTAEESTSAAVLTEDTRISSRFLELFQEAKKPTKEEPLTLIPGGEVFGIKIKQCGVSITEVREKNSPLAAGDVILSIDGRQVTDVSDLTERLRTAKDSILLRIRRDGKEQEITLTPQEEDGTKRLGITVRDAAAGIGTVTYYDPNSGAFGGLGHGICDPDTGELIAMREGVVTEVLLGGVERGESGKAGELRGVLKREEIGTLSKNCEVGVSGILQTPLASKKEAVPVGCKEEVHEGEATLLSTVTGDKPAAYSIRLHEIRSDGEGQTKSFRVTVTDDVLIAMTGGIVRGMSGSPILQDGKLIGALTHVMVADPTEGYGIFIENMLNAAEYTVSKAA